MSRARWATSGAGLMLVVLVANHWWVGIAPARFGGVAAWPGLRDFLITWDHFAVDYGYLLLPLLWVALFVAAPLLPGHRADATKDTPSTPGE